VFVYRTACAAQADFVSLHWIAGALHGPHVARGGAWMRGAAEAATTGGDQWLGRLLRMAAIATCGIRTRCRVGCRPAANRRAVQGHANENACVALSGAFDRAVY